MAALPMSLALVGRVTPCAPRDPQVRLDRRSEGGAVLLEVVLALALFVFAAAVISGGLNSAATRVERLRLEAHAVDLAATVMTELELGIRPLSNSGEETLPAPFEDWTARVETSVYTFGSGEVAGLSEATVRIQHPLSGMTYRLTQLLPATPIRSATAASPPGEATSGSDGAPFAPSRGGPP